MASRGSTLRAVFVVLAAGLAFVLASALVLRGGSATDEPEPLAAAPRTVSGELVEMAAGVLSPRDAPVTAWTGTDLVVVGGTAAAGPARDGAAYDVATGTWRRIADAPGPVDARQYAVWTGAEVVVAATSGVYAYDPAADSWQTYEQRAVPRTVASNQVVPVVTSAGIVYPASDQPDGSRSPDLVLSDDGTFASLPRDPFGASWDRSMAWDGERLWLLSTSAEEDAGRTNDDGRVPARVAVLEGGLVDGTWRVVDEATPELAPEALLWWCEDRLVVDRSGDQEGQTFEPGSGSWTRVTGAQAAACAQSATERDGLAGGSTYDALASRFAGGGTGDGVDCPLVRSDTVHLRAGDDVLVWDSLTTLGCRTGGPADALEMVDPCPTFLVADGRTRSGFGPVTPSPGAPALPAPDAAYLCRYLPEEPPRGTGGGYRWGSDLCCEAVALTPAELARLTQELEGLAPGRSCRADDVLLTRPRRVAGPRYLLTLRSGADLTGVVLDDFGCGHVRLTDDPFELEPGTHRGSGGVRPGVLRTPGDLVDRLGEALRLRYPQVEGGA